MKKIFKKTIKIISLILLITITTSCWIKLECADFEFGEFKITSENGTTYIERKENIQIEKNGDEISISDIEWINDCTYILKNHRWENGDLIEEEKNNIYTVEIIEFSEKTLKVRTKSNYSDLSVERVMEIVE